ncbi:MAG: L-rhamnose mutarotase [Lentisphaerae bacterium]|nr:L-rhamnose mutarotase [Lentisphaerota bacterium]
MKRVCFLLQVKKGKLKEYLAAHQVWPEMLAAIREAGIRNYSLFARPDGMLVGYFEAENPEQSLAALGRTDVNRRWQENMAPFFASGSGDLKKGGIEWLEQYFYTA